MRTNISGENNANRLVSAVLGNQIEQGDVEVNGVTITSMAQEIVRDTPMARGTALVNITKLHAPRYSRQPRKEHWAVCDLLPQPAQMSAAAQTFPQFETINPLGLTTAELHENRISVEPIHPAGPVGATGPGIVASTIGAGK